MTDFATLEKRWRLLRALQDCNYDFGPIARANYEYECAESEARGNKDDPRLRAAHERCSKADDHGYRTYDEPAADAAITLVNFPAPDVAAVQVKIEAIKHHELDNYLPVKGEPFDFIEADVKRLLGELER
ncbi:hypothetical protein WJT74_05245 [Sphingomicrobium sp. XHP0239]|uniref:hypothetical protein n=1 Tax=Sphingomicrobium maritimum TaxID=3133972 RepID=UPI0031CC8507